MNRFTRSISFLFFLVAVLCCAVVPMAAAGDKTLVRVMTRNMDAGTDLNYVAAATNNTELLAAAFATLQEVVASRIPERAARLADEIAASKPDLVGLQEATLWRTGDLTVPAQNTAKTVLYDQIDLLVAALNDRGVPYRVAAVQVLSDVEVPVPQAGKNVRFTDRNAILVRADLPPGHLDVLGTETRLFTTLLPLPGVNTSILCGWIAADVKVRGARFKFVTTHLQSATASVPATVAVQVAQSIQLVQDLASSSLPVILAGDFNANGEEGVDHFATWGNIIDAGFADAWHIAHPSQSGNTWPLFLEDQPPPNYFAPAMPFERIDMVFFRGGPELLSVELTGTAPNDQGVFASDHAGVVAEFEVENHRPEVPAGDRK